MPPEARGLSSLWFPNRMLTLSDHPLLELQSVWALGGPNIQEQKSIVAGFQNSHVCFAHQMPILRQEWATEDFVWVVLGGLWRANMLAMCVFLNRIPAILASRRRGGPQMTDCDSPLGACSPPPGPVYDLV